MKIPTLLNLRNSAIALSIIGLSLSSNVQAHYEVDELIPYYYFFYDLNYSPRHHHYNRGHLIKKHNKKHHHKRHHSDRHAHNNHRKSYSRDHYSRHKSRDHKRHDRNDRHRDTKRRIKKHDRDDD